MSLNILPIVKRDGWLEPVADKIYQRNLRYTERLHEIERSVGSIVEYANAYLYYGLHRDDAAGGWWFREWLPEAHDVFIFGDFNNWQRTEIPLVRIDGGVWEAFLSDEKYHDRIKHESLYKILVNGNNGWLERLPAYVTRTYEDPKTHNFSAQVWNPEPYSWDNDRPGMSIAQEPLIYEAHVGMAQEQERVGSFRKFTRDILPRIKSLGYNTVQLMAIAEHPYYGSFGYHVSNFYAPSSRFGTPEELKNLVKTAHSMGLAVVMDIVHSHYVKNTNEGINELDGSNHHYSVEGGDHPYWDSKLFDYGKSGVEHFLLSNIKYWIEEFHFDGFRFDGVTSMVYHHHGYKEFVCREDFFDEGVNEGAIRYLTLANTLVHKLAPKAITIAEDVSGMPGMCVPIEDGGIGFDYRLGMAVPDYWIKLLEDVPDEDWDIEAMWNQLLNRLPGVKTIAYAESHDQALVGDKTIAFRLMDKEMYFNMNRTYENPIIDRGMALHKLIRLFTATTGGVAYLNFMGNEFGHPEWVDFPREGNGWSYEKARRQWSLADNGFLRYSFLQEWDKAMIKLIGEKKVLKHEYPDSLLMDNVNKTIAYSRNGLLFVINWHPNVSLVEYRIPVPEPGKYRIVLNSDDKEFGGFGRISADDGGEYFSATGTDGRHFILIYNINRAALVFEKID